jgi:hypothetical protein
MGNRVIRIDAPIPNAIRLEAFGLTEYTGPDTGGRQDAMRPGYGLRRDGTTEVDVEGLLQRVQATEAALKKALVENSKLSAALHAAEATGRSSDVDPAVLDSRHTTRATVADDYDPFERQQQRLSNQWRENATEKHADSARATSAGDDYDPAARMQQRLSHGRSR